MMGIYFKTTFRKNTSPREQKNVFFALFPQKAPSQLSCTSVEITKRKKIYKKTKTKIHISEKLLRVPALD